MVITYESLVSANKEPDLQPFQLWILASCY